MPAFRQESEDKRKRGEKKANPFDLIPSKITGADEYRAEIYRMKMICYIAADGDAKNQEWLFSEKSLFDVYEQIMFRKANEH